MNATANKAKVIVPTMSPAQTLLEHPIQNVTTRHSLRVCGAKCPTWQSDEGARLRGMRFSYSFFLIIGFNENLRGSLSTRVFKQFTRSLLKQCNPKGSKLQSTSTHSSNSHHCINKTCMHHPMDTLSPIPSDQLSKKETL